MKHFDSMQDITDGQKIWETSNIEEKVRWLFKAETEKERELEYLRGKVAAYETALRLLAGERGIEPSLAVVK